MSLSNEEKIKIVLEKLKSTEKDVIRIKATDGATTLTESKFGGLPYLPIGATIPQDVRGGNLYLVAQFNLSELPANSFPIATGILQFWIANDDSYGLDVNDIISQKHSRVVYYPSIETYYSEVELSTLYTQITDDDFFPILSCFKLSFEKGREIISTSDYPFHFNDKFVSTWNSLYQDDKIEKYIDVLNEDNKELFKKSEGVRHKLLGYPHMYHSVSDNRVEYPDYILLFQMASDDSVTDAIVWGDLGCCDFFISEEDLKACDFSKVAYTWHYN